MPSPRPLLALAGGVLAIILASLGGVAYVTLRTGPLAERLVRDVEAMARTRYPRPSHVTPAVPGTFAQHLDPLMGEVLRLYRERSVAFQSVAPAFPCRAVIEGREPVSALPTPCQEEWKKGRELVARVLAATHAEEGGLPEGMGDLASPTHPYADTGMPALLHVIQLAALETRLLLAEGQAEKAVDTCLDTLALSRELTLGGGLIGQMTSATGQGLLYRPCAAALDAAPMERKRSAVAQLSRLAEGQLPFSQMLKQESVVMQLMLFGELMPAELLAALPEGAREAATKPPALSMALEDSLTTRFMWRKVVEGFDALIAVADREPAARRRAFETFDAQSASALFPVDGPSGVNYSEYAERVDLARLQHDALISLVEADLKRTEEGRWPERVTSRAHRSFVLESSNLGEARLKPCAPSQAEQALRVTADVPSGVWVRQTP
ncbi:hypothetical protein [Pyxidicoccus sp. MSG2]|uniref:hypothetical protein n=1 Tax=Pyxidicoccus sp. MSG2 TaxID=2996790 RepID=UPI00226D5FFE|nr:hypothetical protein [Pyxidicoccus sp. MSG2]MCY1016979.1 hypothetical protein [Pyxidicoccus sp. MSG2]